jgi:hypothetical protein
MGHMRKFFSVGITCFFLNGCAIAPDPVPPQVWGALIVAGAVATAVDTVISGPSGNEVNIDNIDSHSGLILTVVLNQKFRFYLLKIRIFQIQKV